MTMIDKLSIELTNLLTRVEAYRRLAYMEVSNLDHMNELHASAEMKAKVSREALDRDLDIFTDLMVSIENVIAIQDQIELEEVKTHD